MQRTCSVKWGHEENVLCKLGSYREGVECAGVMQRKKIVVHCAGCGHAENCLLTP